MSKLEKLLLTLITAVIFTGCQQTPYTNRSQMVFYSPAQEVQMGLSASQEILKNEKLSKDKEKIAMVERIGKKIANVARKDEYKWEFYVIQKDVMNAFCLPGGKVFVYEGIFKAAQNEDQLATVMSHEVAHALARHGAERMSMAQVAQLGKVVVQKAAGLEGSEMFDIAYGLGAQYGVMLPYSRKFEYEADEIGLYLMDAAGYDVNEAVKFWENMRKMKDGPQPPEFISTHPADGNRIARIQEIIASQRR